MVYQNLRALRESLSMTQKDFAASLGIGQTTYNGYETGARDPKSDFWIAVAQKYGVTIDYLMGFSNDPKKTSEAKNAPSDLSEEAHRVAKDFDLLTEHGKGAVRAILDYEHGSNVIQLEQPAKIHQINKVIPLNHAQDKASAGTGFQLSEDRMDLWMVVYNEQTRKADFCVDVVGDSMEPMYHDGDTILIRQQPSVDVGEIGLFVVDGKGYVKRQGTDCLESINSEYKNICPGEYSEVECMGKVIGALQENWIIKT